VTALAAIAAHDARHGNSGFSAAPDPEFEAAGAATDAARQVEEAMAALRAEPDLIRRREASPRTERAIECWSIALRKATPSDELPLMEPYIEKTTGAAYAALLAILEWQVVP
jgi:hypothetical protein